MDTKELFALADADDAAALEKALAHAPETFRRRNESGETLVRSCVFRGQANCAEFLKRRGQLSRHEARFTPYSYARRRTPPSGSSTQPIGPVRLPRIRGGP